MLGSIPKSLGVGRKHDNPNVVPVPPDKVRHAPVRARVPQAPRRDAHTLVRHRPAVRVDHDLVPLPVLALY